MKLLLIESTPGNAAAISQNLVAEGHDLISCADEHGGPCKGTRQVDDCPMGAHIDLAIVTREPDSVHTLDEMGSVCAKRHRVPLVEVDPIHPADDLPSVDVAIALAARRVEAGYATAVRHELGHQGAIVDVHRDTDRIQVNVKLPAAECTTSRLSAVADRARMAVREHDPFVRSIDVSVVSYPDPA
ncbi:MAG: hypothetical protein WCI22_13635 [Actinomycetota bacterium]